MAVAGVVAVGVRIRESVCGVTVHRVERHMVTLTDKEFDDILQRNKNVSSGAIMRAVQDASEGSLTVSLSPMCVCVC